jgi:hypothetical protein
VVAAQTVTPIAQVKAARVDTLLAMQESPYPGVLWCSSAGVDPSSQVGLLVWMRQLGQVLSQGLLVLEAMAAPPVTALEARVAAAATSEAVVRAVAAVQAVAPASLRFLTRPCIRMA